MDYDVPELCDATTITARVPHTCCECGTTIHRGTKYERVKGLWNGKWDEFKTCLKCVSLRDRLDDGNGFVYGCLRDSLSSMARLTDADEDVIAFRERYGVLE